MRFPPVMSVLVITIMQDRLIVIGTWWVQDDMSHDINAPWLTFTPPVVANITANMRRHAPWLTLAPTIYYSQTIPSFERWPDLPLALDSPIFFFRNQREGAGPCAPPACSSWWGPKAKRLPNGTVR